MKLTPHQDIEVIALNCAAITISDTRTTVTDSSGKVIKALLSNAGHRVTVSTILPDEPSEIREQLVQLGERTDLDVIIFNGGTGIGPRDTTYEAICSLLSKTLPGFGELFRFLSYEEIGSRAMTSRAVAGVYRRKLVFSVPGSTNAVKLAMDKLIIPELTHLVNLI
ncbi:MAG: MogA/MoaB family molybdenum cofactor biosynthesis protein [Prochloron sp. SP5CPC1]|nr:MogA/MoaB family molybdenum cofactor biosynthesis protein [Candidatus Paraprochloron terpiosi SP5CPC1]